MIRKILGLFALIFLMAFALVAYSMSNSISESQSAVFGYAQTILAKTKTLASPILRKIGVDIENTNVEDINIVERQVENATNKVDEASKLLSQ